MKKKIKKKQESLKVSPVFAPRSSGECQVCVRATTHTHFSKQLHACHSGTQERVVQAVFCRPGHWLTNTVLLVPVQLVAGVAVAFKSTQGVLTAVLTATAVHTAFVYV